MKRLIFNLLALFTLIVPAPAAEYSSTRWEKDVAAMEAADKANPPKPGAVLFIGSSSIRMWKTLAQDFPEHRVINRGFGGSQICDATYFADRIIIPCKPRLIILGAGGNDINAGKSPEQVLTDLKAFVAKVRAALPEVHIVCYALNPLPKRWAQADKQKRANQLIKDYIATGANLDYINLWDPFISPDGTPREELFIKDRLHPNAEGYKIRTALTRPHLGPPNK